MTTYMIYTIGYTSELVIKHLKNPPEALQQSGMTIVFNQACNKRVVSIILEQIIDTLLQNKPTIKIILDLSNVKMIEPSCAETIKQFINTLPETYDNQIDILPKKDFARTDAKLIRTPVLLKPIGFFLSDKYKNAVSQTTLLPSPIIDITMSYFKEPENIQFIITYFAECLLQLEYTLEAAEIQRKKGINHALTTARNFVATLFNNQYKNLSANIHTQITAIEKCIAILSGSLPIFTENEKEALQSKGTTAEIRFRIAGESCPEFTDAVLNNSALFGYNLMNRRTI